MSPDCVAEQVLREIKENSICVSRYLYHNRSVVFSYSVGSTRSLTSHSCLSDEIDGNFFLHHRVQHGSGAHPASYPMGTRGSFPGVKRQGREADHSPPSSAEVKEWVELYIHSPHTASWHGT
jgi:hypothetical protein